MYKDKNFTLIFIKMISHIKTNKVIQLSAKFKEDRIISFWVIVYESSKNMVLRKTRLKFKKVETQWSLWLPG